MNFQQCNGTFLADTYSLKHSNIQIYSGDKNNIERLIIPLVLVVYIPAAIPPACIREQYNICTYSVIYNTAPIVVAITIQITLLPIIDNPITIDKNNHCIE